MSNGAMMALRLACEAPEVFGAVVAVAGTEATTRCAPTRPVAVLQIHALDDDHVLYTGGAGAAAFRDRSQVMDFVSVPETVSRWVARNRCPSPPRPVLDQPGARCERYAPCAEGVTVQACTTQEGGHSWPGATPPRRWRAATPSRALDATRVITDFLHTLPAWR